MTKIPAHFMCTVSPQAILYPSEVRIEEGIFNPHTHPREDEEANDGRAEMLIPQMSEVYADIGGIGNTSTPLTTIPLARAMGPKWNMRVPPGMGMRIRVVGLLTEDSKPEDIVAGYDQPEGGEAWYAMKIFIRGASNDYGASIDDVSKIIPCIRAGTETKFRHKKGPIPFMIHAERKWDVTGRRIHVMEREFVSIQRDILYILEQVPRARLIVCHISDWRTLDLIRHLRRCGFDIWGEIAPHYAEYTLDDLFEGPDHGTALNVHCFCIPVFKDERSRSAIENAMVSGEFWWIFATDEACHADDTTQEKGVKINSLGLASGGQTQIPKAVISYVIEKFVVAGRLQYLEDYLSRNGRRAFNLEPRRYPILFKQKEWEVPKLIKWTLPTLGERKARVIMGGQVRQYVPERLVA